MTLPSSSSTIRPPANALTERDRLGDVGRILTGRTRLLATGEHLATLAAVLREIYDYEVNPDAELDFEAWLLRARAVLGLTV